MIIVRWLFILSIVLQLPSAASQAGSESTVLGKSIIIQRQSSQNLLSRFSKNDEQGVKIAVLSAPKIIGKYSQSIYNVSISTLLGAHPKRYELKHFTLEDESSESIDTALQQIRHEGFNAILAPLTANGAKHLMDQETYMPIFVPTVHRRDFPNSSDNIVFGAIDYESQIEALLPYMSDSIAVFYDKSYVGENLKSKTESLFVSSGKSRNSVMSYPIDIKGDKIVSHLSKPSSFTKRSVVMHIPVVKSSILAAHLTFTNAREKNILSTQINVDPTLLSLTQYNDRKNMILANSLIDFPDSLYQANEMMGNDLSFDWVNYASSVGIDYLVAVLENKDRTYNMRIVDHQVIYPIELVQAKEYGFESYRR